MLDSLIFVDIFEYFLHGLEADFGVSFVRVRLRVKNNFIMRHVIEHLEEHDITELSGFEVHDIIINNVYLFVFEQQRVLR